MESELDVLLFGLGSLHFLDLTVFDLQLELAGAVGVDHVQLLRHTITPMNITHVFIISEVTLGNPIWPTQ